MGLDNYASRIEGGVRLTDSDKRAFEGAGIELCGGVFTMDAASFHGTCYSAIVQEVTGVDLSRSWLSPETVRAMARALNALTPEDLVKIGDELAPERVDGGADVDEMAGLQCFFTICAGRGLGIIGWGNPIS